jgi:coenzyme Q-binding protein COQ10
MATFRTTRSVLQTCHRLSQPTTTQKRTFLPNPFADTSAPPQVLRAHRVLPYPSAPIYSIIADVPSYSSFLPYCQRSDITHWSAPDKTYNRRWPSEGKLTSGFGGITESFISRVYCEPGKYVESVGGDTETSLSREEIAHHLESGVGGSRAGGDNGLLKHLRSIWTIEELGESKTGVSLALEFAFTNPFYAALSGGVAPKVADVMIRAFEQRVEKVLGENPDMIKAGLADLDGSRLKR